MTKSIFHVVCRSMRRRGRPKKPKAERRERQLHILLTASEHKAIEAAAKAESLGASTWARSVILNTVKARKGKVAH